ncbi:MAG: GAF domain-containing protein, partial [Melioribacteraceae bacterium]
MDLSEKRQLINKNLGDFLGKTSEGFMKLTSTVKPLEGSGESLKTIDSLFKNLMEFNRQISKEINIIFDGYESLNGKIEKSENERSRLERLYASGILFQSETEMKALMEKAVDTVVKELNADEGFIVLLNGNAEIDEVVAKNMDPEKNNSAKELSTTIINNAVRNLKPLQLNDISKEIEFSTKHSIISLGLTSAICVPLISGNKVHGAVYLDRRNKDEAFTDYDLTFLIAFSKQIVKGIEVSKEITELEEKLIAKPQIEFKMLREQFASDDMIGTGKKLFNVLKVASKVSNTDASVFILGENGTGKELLARAIHANSSRSGKPFVAVNCGAIPADLLESELFGYESGAFTGAVKSKPGRMEVADGGTIFLDEIGEMSFNLQAKLLRIIQTKEIERLGGVGSRKIDVRFISATNKNILQMISEKEFREDLYYRLK